MFGGLINKRAPSCDHLESNVIILLISLQCCHGNQISTGSFSVDQSLGVAHSGKIIRHLIVCDCAKKLTILLVMFPWDDCPLWQ